MKAYTIHMSFMPFILIVAPPENAPQQRQPRQQRIYPLPLVISISSLGYCRLRQQKSEYIRILYNTYQFERPKSGHQAHIIALPIAMPRVRTFYLPLILSSDGPSNAEITYSSMLIRLIGRTDMAITLSYLDRCYRHADTRLIRSGDISTNRIKPSEYNTNYVDE